MNRPDSPQGTTGFRKVKPRQQQDTPSRRRRKAARAAQREQSVENRIQGKAKQRQRAWHATGHPNLTARLTTDLDELYGDLRDERAGQPGERFVGRTSRPPEPVVRPDESPTTEAA